MAHQADGIAIIAARMVSFRKSEESIRIISADASAVTVLVVPTDEELEIARQTLSVAQP